MRVACACDSSGPYIGECHAAEWRRREKKIFHSRDALPKTPMFYDFEKRSFIEQAKVLP